MKVVKKDIVHQRFGSLVVQDCSEQRGETPNRKTYWLCRCDCGHEMMVERNALRKRKVMYCPVCRPRGVRNEKLYHIYHGMRQRCLNPNNPKYQEYGGRGIRICQEWLDSYEDFRKWAEEHGYCDGLTIDREKSDGNYCPENCRWITLCENSARANIGRHKNATKLINPIGVSPDGVAVKIDNLTQFCDTYGLNLSCVSAALHGRITYAKSGWQFYSDQTKQTLKV